jgi:hypothetical protein
MSQVGGKRLTYAQLTGKDADTYHQRQCRAQALLAPSRLPLLASGAYRIQVAPRSLPGTRLIPTSAQRIVPSSASLQLMSASLLLKTCLSRFLLNTRSHVRPQK